MLSRQKFRTITVCIAVMFIVSGRLPATANSHLNCQAYAQSVINQVSENNKWGCGFTGARWSPDYNLHFNWCNGAQMVDLTNEDKARKAQLQQCKLTKPGSGVRPANAYNEQQCDNYAKQMVGNAKINITRNCGINDPRMHTNYQAHWDWCFNGRTKQQVRATLDEVIRSIEQCGTDKAVSIRYRAPKVMFDRPILLSVCYGQKDFSSGKCNGKIAAQKFCEYKNFQTAKSFSVGAIREPTAKLECKLTGSNHNHCFCETIISKAACRYFTEIVCQGKVNKP